MKINHDILRRSSWLRVFRWWLNQRNLFRYAINRFQWHWYPRLGIVRKSPIHMDIELTSKCQLKCPMCFRQHRDIPKTGNMDIELFKKIIDDAEKSKVYSLKFTGRGEGLLNPQFAQMMQYLQGKKFGEIAMITNGLCFKENTIDAVIEAGMDFISFSIDGLKEQYEKLRHPGKYEQIYDVVKRLFHRRQELNKKKPMIRIQSIMIPADKQAEFLDRWGPISDDILFLHFKDYSQSADNVQIQQYTCPLPFQRMMVHFDGTVPMCINDEYEESVLGDLKTTDITGVWLGEKFAEVRKSHRSGVRTDRYPNCARCALTRENHGNE